jgi:catechol-2,3-dioxygenase
MAGIAKMRAVVLDCPDPRALAEFYRELVGGDVTYADEEWVSLRDGDTVLLSFQRALDYQAPEWPDPGRPQQFHLDVTVDEAHLDEAERQVLVLGAMKHELQPGGNWRVYVDPVGHPFCLCWD